MNGDAVFCQVVERSCARSTLINHDISASYSSRHQGQVITDRRSSGTLSRVHMLSTMILGRHTDEHLHMWKRKHEALHLYLRNSN